MLIFFFFRKCQVYVMPLLSENVRKRGWNGIFQSTCEKVWAWRYGNKTVDLPPVFQQSSRCLVTLPSRSRHALVTLVRQKLGIFLLILHTFGMVRHAPVTVSSRSLGAAGCPNFPEHIDQCHTKETQCSTCLYFFTVTEKSTLSVFLPRGLTIQKKFEGSSKGRSMHLH